MTTQAIPKYLGYREPLAQTNRLQRLGLFIAFLLCEAAIFIFGSRYFDVFPTNRNLTFNLILSAIFLTFSLWCKYTERWNKYRLIIFAFFIASVATPISALTGNWVQTILDWFAVTVETSKGLAIEKDCEMLLKTVPIIALVKLSGADMGSIFLKRGSLKVGLGVGILVFLNFSTSALLFFTTRYTNLELLGNGIVWGFVFSLANAFMEELWLRGIFLKHFEPLLGVHGSVWLTSIIFGLMHGMAFYFTPAVLPFFIINTLVLGLGCGYLMMKSDNIWGATLIHVASDYFLFIAVLANA